MRFVNSLSKRLLVRLSFGALVFLSAAIPVAVFAAGNVATVSNIGVANVTAGDKAYSQAVNAQYNEVIKLQVYYQNTEDASSGKTAQNVRVKVDVPVSPGKAQVVKATVKADNSNVMSGRVAVNLDHDDASLQYIPGSAVWKHDTGSNDAPKFVEEKISDEVVYGEQGTVLENQKPGLNFASTVTVLARVMTPGVKVTKQVENATETGKWADSSTANPGDTLKYLVGYQNTGNQTQNKVVVRDSLPSNMSIVPGSTILTNTSHPNGVVVSSDDIAKGGIAIGNYAAGANAYVTFQAKIDSVDKLACGSNALRATSGVQPENTSEHFASAVTTVARDCVTNPVNPVQQSPAPAPAPTPTAPTPTPQPTPVYSCDMLTLTKGDNRGVTAKVDYTAKDGASFKSVTYNFGDGSQAVTSDKTTASYSYKKDGDYNVTATVLITVSGRDQTVTSANCAKSVSFTTSTPSPAPTPTPPSSTPAPTPTSGEGGSGLPNTGPGNVIALFVAASAVGTLFHRFVIRRFVR